MSELIRKKMRGAKPTPRHKLCGSDPHKIKHATPAQVIVVPPQLEMWLNDVDGDCVTAEEAFAKAAYSVMSGQPETMITDATVLAFCNAGNFLNGANLTDVMDAMISGGFVQDAGYKDGPYTAVDYSNEQVLQNAISLGPVKIGIDANALPSGAGSANGWAASGGSPGQFSNEDHCVALCGYGPSTAMFQALGVPVPAGFPGAGYLLYTWSTIGVVDHAWIMSTCGEAWLRNPTTTGVGPSPTPTPVPIPPGPAPVPPGPTPTGGIPFGIPITFNADGTFTQGQALNVDMTKLPALIDAFNAFLMLSPTPTVFHAAWRGQMLEAQIAQKPQKISIAKLIQIAMLVFGWYSGGANPALLPALLQQIMVIITGP